MIEARAPFANEKAITPTSITKEQNNLSIEFVPEMSP